MRLLRVRQERQVETLFSQLLHPQAAVVAVDITQHHRVKTAVQVGGDQEQIAVQRLLEQEIPPLQAHLKVIMVVITQDLRLLRFPLVEVEDLVRLVAAHHLVQLLVAVGLERHPLFQDYL